MEERGCPYEKYALRNVIPIFTLDELSASNLIYNSTDNTLVDADLNCASDKLVKDRATEGPSGYVDTYPQASSSTDALNLAAGQDCTNLVVSPINARKPVVSAAEIEEGCELELRSTTSLNATNESVEHNLIGQTKTHLNNSLVAGGRFAMDLNLPSDFSIYTSTTQNEVETETPIQVNQDESSDISVPRLEEKAKMNVRVSIKSGSGRHPKNRYVLKEAAKIDTLHGSQKRGRGRTPKIKSVLEEDAKIRNLQGPQKRGRGRPPKIKSVIKEAAKIETLQGSQKRGRGRPPKIKSVLKEDAKIKNLQGPQKRGRGRPPKNKSVVSERVRKNKTRKVVLRIFFARTCKPIHDAKNCSDCIKPLLKNRLRKTCPTCNMQANCLKFHRVLHSYKCRIVLTKVNANNNLVVMQDCQLSHAS